MLSLLPGLPDAQQDAGESGDTASAAEAYLYLLGERLYASPALNSTKLTWLQNSIEYVFQLIAVTLVTEQHTLQRILPHRDTQ